MYAGSVSCNQSPAQRRLREDTGMAAPKELYKTTIIIWSDFNPANFAIDELAREAISGDAYCSEQNTEYVTDAGQFPKTEFFDSPEPDEDDDEDEDEAKS